MAQVPQASMRSTDKRVHELTLSPYFSRNLFQPSSMVKSSLAGRGIYIWLNYPMGILPEKQKLLGLSAQLSVCLSQGSKETGIIPSSV